MSRFIQALRPFHTHITRATLRGQAHAWRYQTAASMPAAASSCGSSLDHHSLQPACLTTSGRKAFNEDRSNFFTDDEGLSVFAVFDGHSGPHAADFASSYLASAVNQCRTMVDEDDLATLAESVIGSIDVAFRSEALPTPERCRSGTTATLVLMRDDRLVVANCGDSRAVLFGVNDDGTGDYTLAHSGFSAGGNGVVSVLTEEHRPDTSKAERDRIRQCGGRILRNRVNGSLAMTRAIGAYYLRPFGVISDPHVHARTIKDTDCFVVLGSDGLFDFVSDEEACDAVRVAASPDDAVHDLVELALSHGSSDNVTAMVIPLPNWDNRILYSSATRSSPRNLALQSR